MKLKTLIYLLLFFIQYLGAQVNPIKINTVGDFTIYETNFHEHYTNEIKNQTYTIKRKIFDINTKAVYRSESGFDISFFQHALSESNYTFLRSNRSRKSRFSVVYVIDELGNVLSSSLHLPTNLITLSSSEIENILTESINHKFDYIKKPIDLNKFYFTVKYDFIL